MIEEVLASLSDFEYRLRIPIGEALDIATSIRDELATAMNPDGGVAAAAAAAAAAAPVKAVGGAGVGRRTKRRKNKRTRRRRN
jgi:hypothetical protein